MSTGRLPRVSVVIPTRNRAALLTKTLKAIAAQAVPQEWLEVLVVDNGSSDETPAVVEQFRKSAGFAVTLLHMKVNGGPARSRNEGASAARGEYIAFVDSDVELQSGWLGATVAALDGDSQLGMVTGRVVFAGAPDTLYCFGGALSKIGLGWDASQGEAAGSITHAQPILWSPSASVLLRRDAFMDLGGFDSAYFYGYEDSDLGWRFNIAGWRCLALPNAVAVHATDTRIDEATRKIGDEIVYHYSKNRIRSLIKNYERLNVLRWLAPALAYSILNGLLRRPRGSRLRAVWWNLKEIRATLRLRRFVQTRRRVSDAELRRLFTRSWFPQLTLPRRMEQVGRMQQPPGRTYSVDL